MGGLRIDLASHRIDKNPSYMIVFKRNCEGAPSRPVLKLQGFFGIDCEVRRRDGDAWKLLKSNVGDAGWKGVWLWLGGGGGLAVAVVSSKGASYCKDDICKDEGLDACFLVWEAEREIA